MQCHFAYAVEAVAFFGCACQYAFTTIQYQFIYQVVSEELNFTKYHSVEYCTPNATTEKEQAVVDEVSIWTLYTMIAGYITCAIGSTVTTAWSDSIGRKVAISLPVIGALFAAILQCFVIAYRLPLYTLIIAQVILGISGTYSALLGIGSAYLSDIVRLEDRAKRFNMLEISSLFGGGIVQTGIGYWITADGFVPSSIFISCCAFIAMLFIPLMKSTTSMNDEQSETSPLLNDGPYDVRFSKDEANRSPDSCIHSLQKQLMASWNIYTTSKCVCDECLEDFDNSKHGQEVIKERTWRLWFYALAFTTYMFAICGIALFITMFIVSYPVYFTPVLVGAQWGLSQGLIIVVPLVLFFLQGYLKFEGQTIILIGIFTRIISCILLSFARGPILVFTATSLAVVYSLTTSFMRAEVSRLVSSQEQGAVFAVMAGLQNLAAIFSPLAFLTLFPATLHIFHGFSFIVAALVYAVSFVLMIIVWIANKQKK